MSVTQRGFSLVEVVVAMGLSTALTVGAASFLTFANEQRLTLEAQSNAQQFGRDIAQATSSPTTCLAALTGLQMPATPAPEVDFAISMRDQVIKKGTVLAADHFTVRRLWLSNINPMGTPGPNGIPMTYADVMLDAQPTTSGAVQLRARAVARVYMEVAGGSLRSCTSNRSLPDLLKLTCAQMGGAFSAATTNCDMTPYVNLIVADARQQIDTQLYGPYQQQVMAQINTDTNVAMTNAKNNAIAMAGTYTANSMYGVNQNLVNNANGLNNSIANLNYLIATNVANLKNGLASTTAQANSVYQMAQDAYNTAIASYQTALTANANASAAGQYAGTAQNTAQQSLGIAQNAQNTAYYMTSVAWNAMNQATASANGASAANQYAANATGAASAAVGAANGAANYASSAYGQANAAYNYIPAVYNWVNQVEGAVNYAMTAANTAASNASYAAGVANSAATLAQQALNRIPTSTNNFVTQVTFVPGAPPASYHWGVGDGYGGPCPGDASPGGSCTSPGLSCWIFTPAWSMNVNCH